MTSPKPETSNDPVALPGVISGDGAAATAAAPLPQPVTAAAGKRIGTGRLKEIFISFENRDFRYLCLSTLSLGVGQWAQQIGLPLLAYELTGHASAIGGVSAVQGGVGVITAPLAGYLADRYPRRKVLVWSTIASAVQAGILAALCLLHAITMTQLYLLALAGGLLQSMAQPARQSFVYDVSTDETLVNAVAMNSIVNNFARIAAPTLAGALIGFWGTGAAFVVLALTRVIAVVFTQMISNRTRQQPMTTRRNPLAQMLDGFRTSWEDRRVLGLIVVHTIPTFLIIPYLPYLSVLARAIYHSGPAAIGFGIFNTMVGVGALTGLAVLAVLGNPRRKGLLMLGCFMAYSTAVLLVFNAHVFQLACLALLTVGLVNSTAFALNNTLIQMAAPNEARGRVMAVWQMSSGLQPLGALPMGFMIDRFGIALGMSGFMATALVLFVVFTAFWPSVRRM
jgi:MFS family permease